MATMNISVPDDMVEFVEFEVAEGGYASASEVVRDALRLLRRDKSMEKEKLAVLKREVEVGLADAASGRFSKKSVKDISEEVRRESFGG
jgi:antitoxin ParD1/3/4